MHVFILHINKTLYRYVHSVHHSRHKLNIYDSTFEHPIDSFIAKGIPFAIWTVFWFMVSNDLVAWSIHIFTMIYIIMLGHSGYIQKPFVFFIIPCPFVIILYFIGTGQTNHEHELHHKYYTCNYSAFFRHTDDIFNTSYQSDRPKVDLYYLIYNLLFFIFPIFIWLFVITFPITTLVYGIYVITISDYTNGYNIEYLRRLSFWDCVRKILSVSYDNTTVPMLDSGRKYMFCYHPHGIWARGAFFTFALKGKNSPFNNINIKLAFRTWCLKVPFLREILLLLGCCGVDRISLEKQLENGSVAIALDGSSNINESDYHINKKRTGFAKIAKEKNSILVPCIGIGEPYLYSFKNLSYKSLVTKSSLKPLHIVFGNMVDPATYSSFDDVQKAYFEQVQKLEKYNIKIE